MRASDEADGPPPFLEVRGEVYMTNSDLVVLNEAQKRKGESPFANTRNVTAGTVRMLDPRICAQRGLRFFCHSIRQAEGLDEATTLKPMRADGPQLLAESCPLT